MSPQPREELSVSLARRIDEVCTRFEAEWQAGERPRIEDYLTGADSLVRPILLRELILLEVYYRCKAGEQPVVGEYRDRSPELDLDWLQEALASGAPTRSPGEPRPAAAQDRATISGDGTATLPAGHTIRYFGDYEMLAEVGRGGMGVVYKARQRSLDRVVALKMVLAGNHAREQELNRFRKEAEAVARLQHPGIVQVFEIGQHDGQPYFALEYVDGGSLADQLDGTPWPAQRAAALVEQLACVIHAAHQKQIIHRDLKPANVLLTADGAPKVTDFGLAKRLDQAAGATQSGAVVGTPSYMAPEQAHGQGKSVGPAADVYALGAVLYELLTGRPPFKAETALDTIVQVCRDDPVPPARLNPKVHRDLETVCLKCLQKEPGKRYGTALELAADLQRFREGKPVQARRAGALERTVKWTRRNRALATLAGVSCLAALALAGMFLGWYVNYQLTDAYEDLHQAHVATKSAKLRLEFTLDELTKQKGEADRQRKLARQLFYFAQINLAERALSDKRTAHAEQLLQSVIPRQPGEEDLRGFEWYHLWQRWQESNGYSVRLRGHASPAHFVEFSTDGKWLATCEEKGTTKIWDVATAKPLATFPREVPRAWNKAFAVSASLDLDARCRAALSSPGQILHTRPVSPRGAAELAGWQTPLSRAVAWLGLAVAAPRPLPRNQDLTPDGRFLVTGNRHGRGTNAAQPAKVTVEDLLSGLKTDLQEHSEDVYCVACSPDGRYVAAGGKGPVVMISELAARKLRLSLPSPAPVCSLSFAGRGRFLAAGLKDGTVCLWDLAALDESTLNAKDQCNNVAFNADGSLLAGFSTAGIQIWKMPSGKPVRNLEVGHRYCRGAFSRDGRWLTNGLILWDAVAGEKRHVLGQLSKRQNPHHFGSPLDASFSPDSQLLAVATASSGEVWKVDSGALLFSIPLRADESPERNGPGWFECVTFSPDGRWLALGAGNFGSLMDKNRIFGTVTLWDMKKKQQRHFQDRLRYSVFKLAFSPDGRWLAGACGDYQAKNDTGEVIIWDIGTGKEVFVLKGHSGCVWDVTFSPDGKRLASAGGFAEGQIHMRGPGEIKIWDVATGQELLTLRGHSKAVFGVAHSPDDNSLASCDEDGNIRLWGNLAASRPPF
jgi:WD40 repeat protein